MYNSQYYTCEQIDQRLLQGYLDDYNTENNTSLTKAQFLAKLGSILGVWQGVDDEPIAGSNNLVKSGGVANAIGKLVGERETLEVTGQETDWATLPTGINKIILHKNIPHEVIVESNETIIVPQGTIEGRTTFLVEVKSLVNGTSLWGGNRKLAPDHVNRGDVIYIPALSQDGYLYFEGRWSSTTGIKLVVKEVFNPEYVICPYGKIIADSGVQKLKLPSFSIKRNNGYVAEVGATNIDFSTFDISSAAIWLICLNNDNTISAKARVAARGDEIVLVEIHMASSTTVNSVTSQYFNAEVSDEDPYYSSICITSGNKIIADNSNMLLKVPTAVATLDGINKTFTAVNIAYSNMPGSTTDTWVICVNKNVDSAYVKSWRKLTKRDYPIGYIRYDYTNHVGTLVSPYIDTEVSDSALSTSIRSIPFLKDEYLHYWLSYDSIHLEYGKIEINNPILRIRETQHIDFNLLTDVVYPANGFIVIGNKLTIFYQTNGYPAILYNFEAHTLRAINTWHYAPNANEVCLLKIDDNGLYYGILAPQLFDIKDNLLSDILKRKYTTAEKTIIKGTVYAGNVDASAPDCLSSGNYILVNRGLSIITPHAADLRIRINQYDADKHYIGTSGTASYSDIKSMKLLDNTRFIRIGAIYSSRGYNQQNPITVEAYQEGDFDVQYEDSERLLTLEASSHELNERVSVVEDLTQSLERNLYEDITKDGQGTTWLFYSFNVSKACSHVIEFLNSATNGNPAGVNYLIYGDNAQIYTGTVGANIVAGTKNNIAYGYRNIRVECRVASGESLAIRCSQVSIPEEIDALKVKASDVIERNAYQEPAIRCAGKQSVNTDLKAFAFMHISDTHVKMDDTNHYKCLENAKKVMDYYTNLKCCIITGDIIYDTFADPMTAYDVAIGASDKLYLNVIGNHDAGQANASVPGGYWASVGTDKQVYDKFIKNYVSRWGAVQPQDAEQDGKCYYYKDFTDEKVRIIVLYDFETDFEKNQDETALKYWREACTVRQAQVDWLISTLENTPSDYGVIVAHHINYKFDNSDNAFTTPRLRNAAMSEYQYSSDKQWLEKILTAYQNKTTIDISWSQSGGVVTTLEANHDFSNAGGEFICILAGHTHDDFIGHPADFPNLVLLTVGSDNLHYTGRSCARAYNHLSEDLINIVNVDRNRKTISVVRLGANYSVTGQRRDSITIGY